MFSPPKFTVHVMSALQHHFGSADVRYIMALNSSHLDNLWEWSRMYPFAKIVASEDAIITRRRLGHPELDSPQWGIISSRDENEFKTGNDVFDSEFESMYLDHTELKDVLWLHKPSKTLIEGDYFSNLPAHEQYAATDISADRCILARINNKLRRMGDNRWARRVHWYGLSRLSRDKYNETAERVFRWDFDRVIPCHGDVIHSGGRAEFAVLFMDHLRPGNREMDSKPKEA